MMTLVRECSGASSGLGLGACFRLLGESGAAAVELAVLGHDADEHAGGPAEGEETRHGDDR